MFVEVIGNVPASFVLGGWRGYNICTLLNISVLDKIRHCPKYLYLVQINTFQAGVEQVAWEVCRE